MLSTAIEHLEYLHVLAKLATRVVRAIVKRFPVKGRASPNVSAANPPWPLIEVENEVIRFEQHLNPDHLPFEDQARVDVFRVMEDESLPVHIITAMQAVITGYDGVITHYGWQDVSSKAPPTGSALESDNGWEWPDAPEIEAGLLDILARSADDLQAATDRWRLFEAQPARAGGATATDTKPAEALPTQAVPAGNRIDEGPIHDPDAEPPAGWHGILEGSLVQLTQAICPNQIGKPDPRQLFRVLGMKGVWLRGKGHYNQAWFKDKDRYQQASDRLNRILAEKRAVERSKVRAVTTSKTGPGQV